MSQITDKAKYLYECLEDAASQYDLSTNDDTVTISNICSVIVMDECYDIHFKDTRWKDKTLYLVDDEDDTGLPHYYVDSVDECVGEVMGIIRWAFSSLENEVPFDGDIYKCVKSLEKEFPDISITNVTNANETPNCAYFHDKRIKDGPRIFHIWPRVSLGRIDYYISTELTTQEEREAADKNPKSTKNIKVVSKTFDDHKPYEYVRSKLKWYFDLHPYIKSDKMSLIDNLDDLIDNIETLNGYLVGANNPYRDFALGLLKRGTCFIAVKTEAGYSFYPSRFIGYKDNTCEKHKANKDKDGRITNQRICELFSLDKPKIDSNIDSEFFRYCSMVGLEPNEIIGSFGVAHKFWILNEDIFKRYND